MYSDDSAASEIASDDGEEQQRARDGDDSGVASEIEESGPKVQQQRPPLTVQSAAIAAKPAPVATDDASDAYDDDDYEDDDDGYSVDFEDDAAPSSPVVRRTSSSPTAAARAPPSPPPRRPAAIEEDTEYYEASFEDESRKSMSMSQQSARLVVNLSVPNASGSPKRLGGANTSSKPPSPFPSPNSPHVDLRVLSKPMAATAAPASPGNSAAMSPLPSVIQHQQQHMVAPYWFIPPPLPSREPVGEDEEKKFALLLRKIESKFEDEVESLREETALLQWKERELKAALRRHKDDAKRRKTHLDTKRKRALERRREHDRLLDRLRLELEDAAAKHETLVATICTLERENARLSDALGVAERDRRDVDARNLSLAEKLQTTLSDFHALNLRFEDAVTAKLRAEQRADDAAAQHRVELEVLAHKGRLEVEALQRALEAEVAAREVERASLPESHRRIVAAEKERFEKLETTLVKQMRELETHVAHETLRLETAAAQAVELQRITEDKAEKRVQTELQAIARERDAVDEQRRDLLVSVARTSARLDDERGKLDATRAQLDVRAMKLVEERAALDIKSASLDDRLAKLADEESVLERRRHELTKLGRETLDKSRALAHTMQQFVALKSELETLRAEHAALQERAAESERRASTVELDKARLDKTVLQLQHERLLVAKQRAQSRQFLDGARRLEGMMLQQHARSHKSNQEQQ